MTIDPIIINPINDITVESIAPDTTINLSNNFDDPSTTGLVAQFTLYDTTLGNGITNVLLFDQAEAGAPLTVQNFLNYVNDGDYVNSIIHRSVPSFVIQGGGFTINQFTPGIVPTDPPVQNEFSPQRSNVRGTIAMAKQGDDPNSATSQWFFNLADNSANLDNQNGGFTVFGQALSDADLATIDAIAAVPVFDASFINPVFSELPLKLGSNHPNLDEDDDFVRYQNITISSLDELQFSVVNNTNPSLANVSLENQTLTIDYLPNQTGTTNITIRATTLLGQTIEDTFSITVIDFDPAQYGASYPDLIEAFGYNLDALTNHYLTTGQGEGRQLDAFDEARYLASYDDLLNAFGTDLAAATQHYIISGYFEQRKVDLFDPLQYLASYDDLFNAFGNNPSSATNHFIQAGFREGRSRDIFREDIYLASYGDLIQAFGYDLEAASQHYIIAGANEGRAKALFDPVAYLNNYMDLQQAFGDDTIAATRHYIETGFEEGRTWM